jgi:hypothetical protein
MTQAGTSRKGSNSPIQQPQTAPTLAFVVNNATFPPALHRYLVTALTQRMTIELYARVDDYSDILKPLRFGVALVVQANFQGQIVGALLKHAPDSDATAVVEKELIGVVPVSDYDEFYAFWAAQVFDPSWQNAD